MTSAEQAGDLTFEAPGPGSYKQDPVHFPRPLTLYWTEIHPAAFVKGTSDFARFYGMPMGGLATEYVNGIAYITQLPAPEEEIPQRFARAAEVMAGKLWREQLAEWDETYKPNAVAKHRELQSVDPDALSDDELVEYLGRCRDHHAAMMSQHMRFTASAVVPTGDFVAHAGDWTGLPPAELLGLMRGASPVSAGASAELSGLIAAIKADSAAEELLASDGDPGETLASLRALDTPAGVAMNAYLDLVGNRLLDGFDISEPSALEMPDVLLRAIRTAVEAGVEETDVEAQTTEIRAKVPAEHQEEFDELLGEARLLYRLRDERGVYSDIWASGIMRRAALAAGRRVAAAGRIADPAHFVDAGFDEMCALVTGSGGPSADELAARAEFRATHSAKDAPATLGPPPPAPPDPSTLPPAVARLMRATGLALGALFGSSEAEHEEHLLRGLAASRGVYEGTARLVSGPSDFNRIVQGDVLVTTSTTEAFNILLPLLGAIVTDSGGLLSHSAIVAREYGIPGVVGTREGTERIADGARVRVDGDAGEVTFFGVSDIVSLAEVDDTAVFGSKAVGLGEALRDGLPVPPGVALSGAIVEAVASGHEDAIEQVAAAVRPFGGPFAVRSSAVDEDGADASFAGQHLTLLNVPSADELGKALREIWWSANSDSAITYRKRVGLFTRPSVAVVVQVLLDPETAGVMFTQNPVTGADERMVEASWGLGEAVVAGMVIPDSFRIDRDGEVLERRAGLKRIAIRGVPGGGTVEEDVPAELTEQLCLDDAHLGELNALALRCEQVYGPGRDIEWAIAGGTLYLLQCRAVTRAG